MHIGKWSTGSGAIIVLIGFAAWLSIGTVYSAAEAKELIGALSSTGLYLGSAIATASASTLALMLTLIGLTNRSDNDFDNGVYQRISRVSVLSTAALIGSVLLLLMLVLPVGEFDEMPSGWYAGFYNVVFATVSLVSGLLVATIVELFLTIRRVLRAITPTEDI